MYDDVAFSASLQGFKFQFLQSIPIVSVFETYNPSSSSELALYALYRLDIMDLVWIPEWAAVFHSRPYQ